LYCIVLYCIVLKSDRHCGAWRMQIMYQSVML